MVIQSIWGKLWRGVLGCVHLLEWGLARGDVGEDVGETLGGHCERGGVYVWSVVKLKMFDWEDAGITIVPEGSIGRGVARCSANREPRPNAKLGLGKRIAAAKTPLPESAAVFSALPLALLTIGLPPAMTLHDAAWSW